MRNRSLRSRRVNDTRLSRGRPERVRADGLVAWFKSAYGVTLASGVVSNWADLSGLANNASQSTAAFRPTPRTTQFAGGRSSLFFNADVNGTLNFDTIAAAFAGSDKPMTVIASVVVNTVARNGALFGMQDGAGGGLTGLMWIRSSTATSTVGARRIPDSGGVGLTVGSTETITTNPMILSYVYTGTAMSIYINGVVTSVNASSFDATAVTLTQATLGARPDLSETSYLDIREIAIWSTAISNDHRARVEKYMGADAGVAVT